MANNNRARGQRFEVRCKDYLESLGWKVDRARAILKRIWKPNAQPLWVSSPNDFLGGADLLAVHPSKEYTLFVQCTLGDVSARQRKLEAIPWNLNAQVVMVWTRQDGLRGGIRALRLVAKDPFRWSEVFWRMTDGEPAPAAAMPILDPRESERPPAVGSGGLVGLP